MTALFNIAKGQKERAMYSSRVCAPQRIFIELDIGSEDNELDFTPYHGTNFNRTN